MKQIINSPLFNVSLFAIFWAFQLFFTKLGFIAGANPVTFTIQSSVLNIAFFSLLLLPIRKRVFAGFTKKVFIVLVVAGIIHFSFGSILSNFGVALTTAINAGFMVRFALITTTFLAWIVLKEPLTKSKLLAVGVMLLGVYLVSTKGQMIGLHVGDLFIIGACFSWSLGNVLIKKVQKHNNINPLTISWMRSVFGLPPLIIFVYAAAIVPSQLQKTFAVDVFNLKFIDYVLVSASFGALNTIFLYRTLAVASASYMTLMSNMTSVVVAVLAVLFLKEIMTTPDVIGAGLIILAGAMTYYLKIDKH